MDQGRRQFTDEFKREAVALLASSGRPLLQIASDLGISPSMLRNWRNRSEGRNAASTPGSGVAPTPIPPRTRRRRCPCFAARTIVCGWSAIF
jgi:transposase